MSYEGIFLNFYHFLFVIVVASVRLGGHLYINTSSCSSLGKPRRFSENFLSEERKKLEQYRESVRKHYAELRTGVRDGLPADLAQPLSVGQRVIALHPKTRELHDGSVLTVDHDKCRIQFDRADIGVEFVRVNTSQQRKTVSHFLFFSLRYFLFALMVFCSLVIC